MGCHGLKPYCLALALLVSLGIVMGADQGDSVVPPPIALPDKENRAALRLSQTDLYGLRREGDTWMRSPATSDAEENAKSKLEAVVEEPMGLDDVEISPAEDEKDEPSDTLGTLRRERYVDWGRMADISSSLSSVPSASKVARAMASIDTLSRASPVFSLQHDLQSGGNLHSSATTAMEAIMQDTHIYEKKRKKNIFNSLFHRKHKKHARSSTVEEEPSRDERCWSKYGCGWQEGLAGLRGWPKLWDGFLNCADSMVVPRFLGLRPKHSVTSLRGLASIVDLGLRNQKVEYGALHEMSDILEQYYRRQGGERGVEMHCALPVMEQIVGRTFLSLIVKAKNSSQRIQLIRFSEQRRHVLHNAVIGYLEYLDVYGMEPISEKEAGYEEDDDEEPDEPDEYFTIPSPAMGRRASDGSESDYSDGYTSETSSRYSSGDDWSPLDEDDGVDETDELDDLTLAEGYEKILKRMYLKKVALVSRSGEEVLELNDFLQRNVLLGRVLNIQQTDVHNFFVECSLGFKVSAVELMPSFYGLFLVSAHQWVDIEKLLQGRGPVRSGPFVPGVHKGEQPLIEIFRADGHNRVTFFRFNERIVNGVRPEDAKQYTFSVKGTGLDLGTPVAFDTTNVGEAAASLRRHINERLQPLPFRITSGLVGYDQCEDDRGETFACRFDGSCDSSCSTLDFHNQRDKHKLAERIAEKVSAFKSISNSLIDPYCALVLPKLNIYTARLDQTVRNGGFAMPSQLWQGAHGETSLRYRNMRGSYSNTNKYTWVKPHFTMADFGMKGGEDPVFGHLDLKRDIIAPRRWSEWVEKVFSRLKAKDLVVFPLTVTTSPTAASIDNTKSAQRFFCGKGLPPCFTVLACGRNKKARKCAIVRMNLRREVDIPPSLRKSRSLDDMPATKEGLTLDTPVFGPSTSLMMQTHSLISACFVEVKHLFRHDPVQAVPTIAQYIGKNQDRVWACVMETAHGSNPLHSASTLLSPLTMDSVVFAAEAIEETKEEWYQVMNSVGGHLFRTTASRYNGNLNEFTPLPVPGPGRVRKEVLVAWTQIYNLLGSYIVFVEDRDATSVQNGPSFADRNMGVAVRDADSWGTGYFHGERIASVMNGEAPDGKVTYAARDLVDVYQSLSSIFQNIYEEDLDYEGTSLETLMMDVDIIKGAFSTILNQLFGISHVSLDIDGTSIVAPKDGVYLGMYQWTLPMKTLPSQGQRYYPRTPFGENLERRLFGDWKPVCADKDDSSVFCLSHMEYCLKPNPVTYLREWESWNTKHSPPPPYLEYGAETEFGNIIAAAMKCVLGDDVIAAFDGAIRNTRFGTLHARTGLAELFYGISLDVPARNEGRLTIPESTT